MSEPAGFHLLFSYGTLQQPKVQLALYGRRLTGRRDFLPGWACKPLSITDPEVIGLSGLATHEIAYPTGRSDDRVEGMVYRITAEELEVTDRYEVDAYGRILVELGSGDQAFIYVGSDPGDLG